MGGWSAWGSPATLMAIVVVAIIVTTTSGRRA